jgi:outer membrane lipoprotein-sorting protein
MKRSNFVLAVAFGFMLYGQTSYGTLSGKEILNRVDKNYEASTRIALSTMVIKGERETRTIKIKSWGQGLDKTFSVYLSPPRDKGTKMLKIKDELWTYSPDADRSIKIAGHMLRQSMSGSDVSYEDFMQDPLLSNSYEAKLMSEDTLKDRACYKLELNAIKDDVAYSSRRLWVDKERFMPLKQELYAKSGKLLKVFAIDEVFRVKDRWYPKKMNYKDVMLKGDGTEITIDSIEFDVPIPEYVFTKASLRADK